jgi:peptidoglycan/xylan/chitin deacetylase (PgdA/CDA1 family)
MAGAQLDGVDTGGARRGALTAAGGLALGAAGRARRRLRKVAVEHSASTGVLLYHRVATPDHDPWDLAVSVEHFDEQLAAIEAAGPIVPLDRETQRGRLARLGTHRRRFAVTFDDGYVDNLCAALPVLERHDAPATIFIAAGFLDQASFWWDSLDAIVLGSAASVEALAGAACQIGLFDEPEVEQLAEVPPMRLHNELYGRLSNLDAAEVGPTVEALASAASLPAPRPGGRPMTTTELVELAGHPLITIGAHTMHHPRLSRLAPEEARGEITAGARVLDTLLGPARRLFAYPFGDTSPAAAGAAREAGFDRAFTTESRWISLLDDPMLLPRMTSTNCDGDELARRLDNRDRRPIS